MQAREHRVGDLHLGLDVGAAEARAHDAFDALAHLGVVAVARHVHEARVETLVAVAPREQPHPASLVQIDDAAHDSDELRDAHLEQLVARKCFDDVHDGFRVVAVLGQAEMRDHRIELAAQQRDLGGRHVIRARGPEAEEAMFAVDVARVVEGLHAHVVEITAAMHGRGRVRLGEHQQLRCARLATQVAGQHDGRRTSCALPLVAQDAEAARGVAHQRVTRAAALQAVVTIAEEHEMSVVHPREQGACLARVGFRYGQPDAIELVRDRAGALEQRRKIGDGAAHVFERGVQAAFELARLRGVARPVDLHHLPGFHA